jgi:DNA-binding CsgD family transcriptional regulator
MRWALQDDVPVGEIAMERLREQNFRAIIGFLREAYAQPDVDTFAGWTVQALTRVVGAQRVSYNEMHPKVGEVLPGPLTVARDGRRLTVRFVNAAPPALLLEERRDGPSPEALARLGLTGRESEVLALVARGASNESIAQALGATPRTVAKHVERIHRKLGVDNRTAAAARAHEIWAAPPD